MTPSSFRVSVSWSASPPKVTGGVQGGTCLRCRVMRCVLAGSKQIRHLRSHSSRLLRDPWREAVDCWSEREREREREEREREREREEREIDIDRYILIYIQSADSMLFRSF